jgi:hypothetical protein
MYAAETGNLFPGTQADTMKVKININTVWDGGNKEVKEIIEAPPAIRIKKPKHKIIIGKRREN